MSSLPAQARILVVEDDGLIGFELADAIEAAHGTVIGPARSVAEALLVLSHDKVDAAILDRTLLDGKATPVAAWLIDRAIPFIFYSGTRPERLKEEFPAVSIFQKPTEPERLIQALADLLASPLPRS
jgi:DNA-binding NtrC family response regulator